MDTADTPPRKYDLYSGAFKRDAYRTFAQMRETDPIYRQLGLDGKTPIWFVTRYDDVQAMLLDKRFVRDEALAREPEDRFAQTPLDHLIGDHMLNRDGADHRRLRSLVSQAFTPKRVAELRPRVQAIADELVGAVAHRGRMDLIGDFAFPLPTIVILEMLGIPPEDRDLFRVWSNALIEPPMDEAAQAQALRHLTAFTEYLRALFDARRSAPQDDLITALLHASEDGDTLSESELFSTMVLLIVAGHETTVNLIANAMVALSRHPEHRDALRADPSAMPRAVEEFLRYDGSVERALNRFAAEDVEWKGHRIARGEPVILVLAGANRDPSRFADAERFDPARHPNPHLGFGKGIHYCLGAPLARLETQIALDTLLARLPNVELAVAEEELRWRFLPGFRALEALPVRWDT